MGDNDLKILFVYLFLSVPILIVTFGRYCLAIDLCFQISRNLDYRFRR